MPYPNDLPQEVDRWVVKCSRWNLQFINTQTSSILYYRLSTTVIWNYSLNHYLKNQSVVLFLIYHRSFDGLVGIYDSNWYIKRLITIETDYNRDRYFRPLSHNFRPGDLDPGPLCIGASIGDPIPLPPLF